MIAKILMCTAVVAATVTVILLSVLTPGGQNHGGHHPQEPKPIGQPNNNNVLSLYIQPGSDGINSIAESNVFGSVSHIVVFDQPVTEAPHNTSPVVGRAQGFMLPSAFSVLDLNLNSSEYKGSLSIRGQQTKKLHAHDDHENSSRREEFAVIGGTGHFALATGFAVFTSLNVNSNTTTSPGGAASKPFYHVRLHLGLRR